MKIIEIVNYALCAICAGGSAFCIGNALITKEGHVFAMAVLYGLLSYIIYWGIKRDKEREEEQRKQRRD